MRRRFQLDRDGLFVLVHVIPFPVGMPAWRNNLNQYLALRNLRDLHRTLLIRFEAQFGQLIVMQETARLVVPHIDAGIRDGFVVRVGYLDAYLRGRRIRGLMIFRILGVRRFRKARY